jgi:hypothetical protein
MPYFDLGRPDLDLKKTPLQAVQPRTGIRDPDFIAPRPVLPHHLPLFGPHLRSVNHLCNEVNTLFRPFSLPKPYTSPKDIVCLRESSKVDAYRRVSLCGRQIQMRRIPPHEELAIHVIPDTNKQVMDIRFWWNGKKVDSLFLLLQGLRLHFWAGTTSGALHDAPDATTGLEKGEYDEA